MKNITLLMAALLATALAGIAHAQSSNDTFTLTAKAASGGTSKKPKPVSASFGYTTTGANGARATNPAEHLWRWNGIRENGKLFPKCTAEMIDAQQSDSICPKGSLVATGTILAKLGPSSDLTSNTACIKQVNIYNAGAGKEAFFPYGDPSQCAGVGYLPPIALTAKRSGNTSQFDFVFPDNIRHPLPGVDGGFEKLDISYKKLTKKVKGKTRGYLESYGCGKKSSRTFTYTAKSDPEPNGFVTTAAAGSC